MRLAFTLLMIGLAGPAATGADLAREEQAALQAAAAHVADSVVQIRTVGGLDRVGSTMIAAGPTTGLIISADGYVVSSAFNFAQLPSSILVRLPSGDLAPAKLVAHDKNYMLVLLKVDTEEPLPAPEPAPLEEVRVGQWAVAVGRTFRADSIGTSVGIVSALNRMYGRVLQTDANVSVANYGGPLVDLHGRVLGVLVPMAPQAGDGEGSEVAGAEFYDSGIGFAVPLEHVLGVLDRWKKGEDLLPGKLGIGLKKGDAHIEPPQVTTVWQNSPAAEAGWQTDDLIVSVDGHPVQTQAQLRFHLVPRYAGDQLKLKLRRGEEEIETQVTLAGELAPFRQAFLGVLPARERPADDSAGVTVRGVWPKGPAAKAGIKPGDRLTKIGKTEVKNVEDALSALNAQAVDAPVEVTATRDKQEQTFTVTTSAVPEEILPRNQLPSKKQTEEKPLELKPLVLAEFKHIANYSAPEPNERRRNGLILLLSEEDPNVDKSIVEGWQADCRRDGVIFVIAHPGNETGWSTDDMEFLNSLVRTVRQRFEIDTRRAIVIGQGKAGQLALALAFNRRNGLSGVVSIDAPLPRTLRLPANLPGSRLAFLNVESKNSSFAPLIRKDVEQLREAGYPTTWFERSAANADAKRLDRRSQSAITRWLDGLDSF